MDEVQLTIFEFTDFKEFFRFRLQQRIVNKNSRKKSTITKIAKELGYASPSLLSMILNGKRLPSDEFCESISRNWKLSLRESEYLRLLVDLERRKCNGDDNAETVERLRRLMGTRSVQKFNENDFSLLREWHFFVIRQLAGSKSFQDDAVWISKALRRKISPSQARHALERLESQGFLRRSSETGRLEAVSNPLETTHEVPNASIRIHHRSMMERAMEALEDRPVEERVFSSLTLNIDPKRLPELKGRMLEFLREIDSEFSSIDSAAVGQLNLQFFEHTSEFPNSRALSGGSNVTH
jgi:uncharacterized protein (TIGR02147 family)